MTDFDLPPDVQARTASRDLRRAQDPPPSVLENLLDEEERQQSLRLRQSFSLATGANPDVAGEAQSLGQRLGVDSLVGPLNPARNVSISGTSCNSPSIHCCQPPAYGDSR